MSFTATVNMMKDISKRWGMCGSPVVKMSGKQAMSAVKTTSLKLDHREMALSRDVDHILFETGTGLLHPGGDGGEIRSLTVAEWFSDGEHRVEKSPDAIRLLCIIAEYKGGSPVVANIRLDGGTVEDCVMNSAVDASDSIRETVVSFLKLLLSATASS